MNTMHCMSVFFFFFFKAQREREDFFQTGKEEHGILLFFLRPFPH